MKKHFLLIILAIVLIFPLTLSAQDNEDLDNYIQRLKVDKAGPLKETGFLTAGSDFLYGQDYFDAKNYLSAEWYFKDAVRKQKDNPFANYQLAISLIRQNDPAKKQLAQEYLDAAFQLNPSLKERFKKDVEKVSGGNDRKEVASDPLLKESDIKEVTTATIQRQKTAESNKVKPPAPVKTTTSGSLVFGDYTCHQSVWNGPNRSPAYRFIYKGYFSLNPNGTYRWLDNGATGTYRYDPKTGKVIWLTGYFKNSGAKSSTYQPNSETAQITVNFTDDYRWECGCKKK